MGKHLQEINGVAYTSALSATSISATTGTFDNIIADFYGKVNVTNSQFDGDVGSYTTEIVNNGAEFLTTVIHDTDIFNTTIRQTNTNIDIYRSNSSTAIAGIQIDSLGVEVLGRLKAPSVTAPSVSATSVSATNYYGLPTVGAGSLSGTTLSSSVTASSLKTLGILEGIEVLAPALGASLDDFTIISDFRIPTPNNSHLQVLGHRYSAGNEWGKASIRLQMLTDNTYGSYIGFTGVGESTDITFGTGHDGYYLLPNWGVYERMRINDAGNVLIGNPVDLGLGKLQVTGDAYVSSSFTTPWIRSAAATPMKIEGYYVSASTTNLMITSNLVYYPNSTGGNLLFGSNIFNATTDNEWGPPAYNVFFGHNIARNTDGVNNQISQNMAMGYDCFRYPYGSNNVVMGMYAGRGTANTDELAGCVAIGYNALYNGNGYNSVAIGNNTLENMTAGGYYGHVAIGSESLRYLTTGSYNVSLGFRAGYSVTSGSDNVFIGKHAGYNASQKVNPQNCIAIGKDTYTTGDNQIVIGNTSITGTFLKGTVYATSVSATSVSGTYYGDGTNLTGVLHSVPQFVAVPNETTVIKGSAGSTTTLNLSTGSIFTATVTAATTWDLTNAPSGAWSVTLIMTNGGLGAHTWKVNSGSAKSQPSTLKYNGGTIPTYTTSGIDVMEIFTPDGGATLFVGQSYKDAK